MVKSFSKQASGRTMVLPTKCDTCGITKFYLVGVKKTDEVYECATCGKIKTCTKRRNLRENRGAPKFI